MKILRECSRLALLNGRQTQVRTKRLFCVEFSEYKVVEEVPETRQADRKQTPTHAIDFMLDRHHIVTYALNTLDLASLCRLFAKNCY